MFAKRIPKSFRVKSQQIIFLPRDFKPLFLVEILCLFDAHNSKDAEPQSNHEFDVFFFKAQFFLWQHVFHHPTEQALTIFVSVSLFKYVYVYNML